MKRCYSIKGAFMRLALTALFAFTGMCRLIAADVGFVVPYDDWRTPLQIARTSVADSFYEPVSVFVTNESIEVSFGWTRSDGSSVLPPIRFAILDEGGRELAAWTEPERATGSTAAGSDDVWWSGNWKCDIVRLLECGDYVLTAELDPANTLGERSEQRADNTTFFRFAIKDGTLLPSDVLAGSPWENVTVVDGNDFAQAPHAVLRDIVEGAVTADNVPSMQFGPYVPMDGKAVSSRKKPLDLVFLIDTSGSMSGCIQGLLNNVGVFIEELMKGDANNDPIDDLRVKIVGFESPRYNSSAWYKDNDFSRDLSELKSDLRGLKANGGDENAFDALWYLANGKKVGYLQTSSPFRQKGEAARAVILFTDERPQIPLIASGCKGLGIADVVNAIEEAEINLTVVSTMFTDSKYMFDQLANTNMYATAAKNSAYIRTSSLNTFTQDASALRNLAGTVLSQVETIVVEPMLKVQTEDFGTLSFRWKNDSAAGTNNIFRFDGYNLGNRQNVVTNALLDAGKGWEDVELTVLENGLHTFEWTYRKIGYDGDIVDCGLVSNLKWEPWATQLKVTPQRMEFECEGGQSEPVAVKCNTNWVASADASWVHLDVSGKGDGTFIYTVDANTAHNSRTATITVRAGDNGRGDDVIVERTVTVFQKKSPYVENGSVQILDVGLKSRWPWNGIVDIDFRVVTPAKNVPVTISLVGWDREGEGFGFSTDVYDRACMRNPMDAQIVLDEAGCKGVEMIPSQNGNNAKFLCPSSGVYRITWDLRTWGEILYSEGDEDYLYLPDIPNIWSRFHTPRFCVILEGESMHNGVKVKNGTTSNTVRVDTRGVWDLCGGYVATGTEMIGHPDGKLDPFPWDSSVHQDGLVSVASLMPAGCVLDRPNSLCVLNEVQVEGGVISNDTVWTADIVHLVRDNVFVMNGATLTIEDGATVKFCANTSIFAHYVDKATGCNLISKGAYIGDARNTDLGGDTLFGSFSPEFTFTVNDRFIDDSFPSKINDVDNDGDLDYEYDFCLNYIAIRGVYFSVVDSIVQNENGSLTHQYKEKWLRYYTRGQKYGMLPRPVLPNEEFFGWFDRDVWGILDSNSSWWYPDLVDEGYIVNPENIVPIESYKLGDRVTLYAMSDIPDASKYPENHWPNGDGGNAKITLAYFSTNYTATVHKPQVLSVTVNETVIPPSNYTVTYSGGDFKKVGVYTATVNFLYDYTNAAAATYAIYPTAAADASVAFSPAEYTYSGSKFDKPSVSVRAGGRKLDPDEYSVGWSAGDWTTPGLYTAKVELKGNYEGSLTKTFEIKENPNLAVVLYGNDVDAGKRVIELRNKGYSPRVLYLSGNDVTGNDGVATRGMLTLLKEDLAVRSFVLTNFVCRYDDYASAGSNRCENSYAPGFAGSTLPFLGSVTADSDKCVAHTNGYMSATELLDFLQLAATIPEALLPALPAGATDADVVALIRGMTWGDSDVAAKITTVAAYNRFRDWFERLDAATQAAVEASSRAYISSVVSEILQDAVLLGDTEKVTLSITDFKMDSTSGECSVTVQLKLGEPGVELELKAAKAAFAEKLRIGASLKGMVPASVSDVTSATLSGNRVKLTVKMPSGKSGFVTMKID